MEIFEFSQGIVQVTLPIPSPLGHVHCYLVRGKDGWAVIDTGFHNERTEQSWQQAFRDLGIGPDRITVIVVTHYHPDHFGAAGWLQQWTGAPVVMPAKDARIAEQIWDASYASVLRPFLLRHGTPTAIVEEILGEWARVLPQVRPAPHAQGLEHGQFLDLGDAPFQALQHPGHTPGLMVFWNARHRVLFSNDLILDPISPNISYGPLNPGDPLADYLRSLESVRTLSAESMFPGHGRQIENLMLRCEELHQHHQDRLRETLRWVSPAGESEKTGSTAWQVAQHLFRHVMDTIANMQFALGETLAHLEYLALRHRLQRTLDDRGIVRYIRTAAPTVTR